MLVRRPGGATGHSVFVLVAHTGQCSRWGCARQTRVRWRCRANRLLEETAPWTALKKGSPEEQAAAGVTLVAALEGARIVAVLLAPVTPSLSQRVLTQLGLDTPLSVRRCTHCARRRCADSTRVGSHRRALAQAGTGTVCYAVVARGVADSTQDAAMSMALRVKGQRHGACFQAEFPISCADGCCC